MIPGLKRYRYYKLKEVLTRKFAGVLPALDVKYAGTIIAEETRKRLMNGGSVRIGNFGSIVNGKNGIQFHLDPEFEQMYLTKRGNFAAIEKIEAEKIKHERNQLDNSELLTKL